MRKSVSDGKVRGMKKILLAAVGMTGLLASCGDITVLPGYYNGIGTSSSLTLNGITSYTTDWQLSNAVQDQNGNTIAANTYVICDNKETNLTVGLNWTGGLSKLGIQLKGVNTGDYKNANFYPYSSVDYSGSGTATVKLSTYMAPLSFNQQSITVNPITKVNVKGYTTVSAQGLDSSGLASNVVNSSTKIPVMDCL